VNIGRSRISGKGASMASGHEESGMWGGGVPLPKGCGMGRNCAPLQKKNEILLLKMRILVYYE